MVAVESFFNFGPSHMCILANIMALNSFIAHPQENNYIFVLTAHKIQGGHTGYTTFDL